MNSNWLETTLGQFVRLQRGHDLTASEQVSGNVPIMGSAGQNGTHNKALASGPGVVVGRSGASAGRVHFSEVDYWPHNTCLYVTDFLGNNPRFAYYFLQTLDLASFNSGSAQPSLNRNYLYTISVKIPPRHEQDAIAEMLQALDNRITLLRETNTTLEAIAQALFKSWFIDFDPVHAKMEGRVVEGMDEGTAALVPDELEESQLMTLPKGWRAGAVGEFAQPHKTSVNPLNYSDTLFEHFSLPAFDKQQMPVYELGSQIKSNKTSVQPDAVLLSKLNPHIPRVWLPASVGASAVCSTEFLVFVPTNGASKEFIYCAFTTAKFKEMLCQLVTGTSNSHQRVRPENVLAISMVIPPQSILKAFTDLVKPLFDKIALNRNYEKSLRDLRELLLPRLISGQMRIPEAEAQIDTLAA